MIDALYTKAKVALLAVLVALFVVGVARYVMACVTCQRELASVQRDFAQYREAAAQAQVDAHVRAQQVADALTLELEAARIDALKEKESHVAQIQKLTVRKPCISADALRVLDSSTGLQVRLPEAAGELADDYAAVTATDTDVATWAIDAGQQYAECARRLAALVRWHHDGTVEEKR